MGSHLLIAVGRTPNSDRLDLEATGLRADERGFIPVDDRLETSEPGIYALGGHHGRPGLHPHLLRRLPDSQDEPAPGRPRHHPGRLVPYTVYIDPQLGRIGLTEEQAQAEGLNYAAATMPMSHVARALEVDETRGLMKVVVDTATKQILGCAMLGIEGGEIMSMIEIAMLAKLPYPALRDAVFAHPTLAEALNNLFGKLD